MDVRHSCIKAKLALFEVRVAPCFLKPSASGPRLSQDGHEAVKMTGVFTCHPTKGSIRKSLQCLPASEESLRLKQ